MSRASLWLDFLTFGNGYGIAMPYFDGQIYWLVDEYQKERHPRNGAFYFWVGGFGAQLRSFQWSHPRPGETRRLAGREYRPFNSHRRWLRVDVAWATRLPANIDESNAELRLIRKELGQP